MADKGAGVYGILIHEFRTKDLLDSFREEEEKKEELTRNPHQKLRPNNTTGFKGVYRNGNTYLARINIDGTQKYLGTFATTTKAALAYDRAVIQNKFPSSYLNFVHNNK